MREVQEERRRAVRAVLVDVASDHVLGLGLEERRRIPAQAAPYHIIRKLHIETSRPALFFRTTTGCCSGVSVCVWDASSVAVPPGRAGGRARDRDSNQDAACGGGDADDDALVIRGEADAVAVEVVERLVQAAGDDRGARVTAVGAVRLWGGEVAAVGGTRRGESRGAAVVVARRTRGESFLLVAWKKKRDDAARAAVLAATPARGKSMHLVRHAVAPVVLLRTVVTDVPGKRRVVADSNLSSRRSLARARRERPGHGRAARRRIRFCSFGSFVFRRRPSDPATAVRRDS